MYYISNTIYNMPNILKITVIIIMILLVILIGYIVYLYKKEEQKDKGEKIKKSITTNTTPFKNQEFNTITKPQQNILLMITKSRLKALEKATKLDADELEVLSKIIEKKEELKTWNNLIELTKNEKTYGILNAATLDYLYSIITKKELKNEVVEIIYLLDCLNGGVSSKKGELLIIPNNLDINATLIKILDNNLNESDKKNKLNPNSIKRACLELASNGGYKNLNWAAKQVIARIILDNLGDVVYDYNNFSKILSDENKIYLRLLGMVVADEEYSQIIDDFNKIVV